MCISVVNWLDHGKTLREQSVTEGDTLLLKRKLFFSDQNIDARDPIQLNLLYVQVSLKLRNVSVPAVCTGKSKVNVSVPAVCTGKSKILSCISVCYLLRWENVQSNSKGAVKSVLLRN